LVHVSTAQSIYCTSFFQSKIQTQFKKSIGPLGKEIQVCSSHLLSTFSMFNRKARAVSACVRIRQKSFLLQKIVSLKGLARYDGTS
jgi:hypothetical protein